MTDEQGVPGQEEVNQLITQKVRMGIYLAATILLLGLTAWQAADGNLVVATGTFLGALQAMLSTSKTTSKYHITKE